MRKIEKQIIAAMKNGTALKIDNTAVTENGDVYLHGNHLGAYVRILDGFKVNIDTLNRWPTRTTLSRLRSFGVDVRTSKGAVILNGVRV